jgi:hypothetical protein
MYIIIQRSSRCFLYLFFLTFLSRFFSLYILHVASRHGVLTLFPPPIVLLMALSGTHPLSYPLLSVCLVTAVSPLSSLCIRVQSLPIHTMIYTCTSSHIFFIHSCLTQLLLVFINCITCIWLHTHTQYRPPSRNAPPFQEQWPQQHNSLFSPFPIHALEVVHMVACIRRKTVLFFPFFLSFFLSLSESGSSLTTTTPGTRASNNPMMQTK